MRRLLTIVACSFFLTACGFRTPAQQPQQGPAPAVRTVAVVVVNEAGSPIVGAECALDDVTQHFGTTNGDGYVAWDGVLASLRDTQLSCVAEGYVDFSEHRDLVTSGNEDLAPAVMHSLHADPYAVSRAQLLAVRGALFTVKMGGLPFGPRPFQPDNIAFFAHRDYTKEQREAVYAAWHERGYTHAAIGPFIDPGYHGQIPSYDFRTDPDKAADLLQEIWDHGIIPMVFITPDHYGPEGDWRDHVWTVPELRSLEPILRSERWQRLCRFVVIGWELQGSTYGWSNNQYVEYLSWLADVFPNSVRALHTIADIEAPVGNGDETDTKRCTQRQRDTGQCINGNGAAWARVTPLIHVWLEQSSALYTRPDHVDPDPRNEGRTDEQNWMRLWDRNVGSSLVSRFHDPNVYPDWPKTSANGGPLRVVAGEYLSYPVYWRNWPEEKARHYGDIAIQLGADGYMDGGTLPVPIR